MENGSIVSRNKKTLIKKRVKMIPHLKHLTLSLYIIPVLVTVSSCLLQASCAAIIGRISHDRFNITTESPDLVEIFNTREWKSIAAQGQQIKIETLKLETKIRLRYARTRINTDLYNPHDKPLQASFQINLPQDAFFTTFKLKRGRGREPKLYAASVMKKEDARNIFHYAHIKTNGSITAGFIELSNENNMTSYNLKFTLGPKVHIHAFLIYETQIQRQFRMYPDKIHVYPLEVSLIDFLEISVDVEELEDIKSLQCSSETEAHYHNCSALVSQMSPKRVMLVWQGENVTANSVKSNPFEFSYELNQRNTSTAVVLTQRNGNFYFVHLFVPENLPLIRKHIVFLLDISDSMHGKKLDQLKWAMIEILDDLAPHDFFSIVTFSNEATVWSKYAGDRRKCPIPFPAREEFKESARHYILTKLSATGTTDIYLGMSTAFDLIELFSPEREDNTCKNANAIRTPSLLRQKLQSKLPENVESMIFFLSDGQATKGPRDSSVLLNSFNIINHAEIVSPVPIYTIAFGEDAQVDFLTQLARENGGTFKAIPLVSSGGVELATFYAEISSQILARVHTTFSINGTTIPLNNSSVDAAKLVLINGTEMLTAGQLFLGGNNGNQSQGTPSVNRWAIPKLVATTSAISGKGRQRYESAFYDCSSLESSLDNCLEKIDHFLERLQAYQLLKKLMLKDMRVQEGYSCPKSYNDDSYSQDLEYSDYEDERRECVNPYKDQIIDLAVKFNFVTPYTSFILCTGPRVDIGLTGSMGSRWPGMMHSDQPQKRFQFDADRNGETEEKADVDVVLVPPSHKLLRDGVEVEEPVPVKVVDFTSQYDMRKGQDNTQWLSKRLQDFAIQMFNKLLRPKSRINHNNTPTQNHNTTEHNNNATLPVSIK